MYSFSVLLIQIYLQGGISHLHCNVNLITNKSLQDTRSHNISTYMISFDVPNNVMSQNGHIFFYSIIIINFFIIIIFSRWRKWVNNRLNEKMKIPYLIHGKLCTWFRSFGSHHHALPTVLILTLTWVNVSPPPAPQISVLTEVQRWVLPTPPQIKKF